MLSHLPALIKLQRIGMSLSHMPESACRYVTLCLSNSVWRCADDDVVAVYCVLVDQDWN